MKRSATDTIVEAMESLSEATDNDVIVLIRNSSGDMIYHSTTDSLVLKIGMCRSSQLYF